VSVLVTTGVVLLLLLAITFVYDRVARLKRAVQKNWRQLEQQRQRRRAIAGRIAEACAVPTADARAVEAVAAASQRAAAPAGPPEAARHEAALGEALSALLTASAIAMSAPVAALARELGEAEHAYREARQVFNDTARRYNTAISVVPGSLIARIGGFPRAELFDFP
jgi:LemA protein